MLLDSHCHLQAEAFREDRRQVMARALEELAGLVVVGDDLQSSREAAALAGGRVRATTGLHPHHADSLDADLLDRLRETALFPGVTALGEMGLDYHYDNSSRPGQRRAFEAQLGLALELGMPVVVHSREAVDDTAAMLRSVAGNGMRGVMHCFSGGASFAETCLAMGLSISFAGNVTFPKAEPLREAARIVPLDRLLVETDSPYLAPQPVRGKRCEPIHVRYTAERLAEVKGVSFEELSTATAANARAMFAVPAD